MRPAAPILLNSLPKSGTHLLSRAVELLGGREHFDDRAALRPDRDPPPFLVWRRVHAHLTALGERPTAPADGIAIGTQVPVHVAPARLGAWLDMIGGGRFILGHLEYDPSLSALLHARGVRHLFIIREPAAVLASLIDFVLDTRGMGPHFLAPEFAARTVSERVDLLLDGGDAPRVGLRVRPFDTIYRRMLAWQRDPRCLALRFESLIGPDGGGDAGQQRAALTRIAAHLELPARAVDDVPDGAVFHTQARTFRRGRIDGWRDRLPPDVIERVDGYCAPLRDVAGYDRDGRLIAR